jgi:hypothetical protein
MKYILLLISQIMGYKILDYATTSKEQAFKFCPFIDTRVIDHVFDITNDIRATTDYNFMYNNDENTKLTICNENLLDGQKAYLKTTLNKVGTFETVSKKEIYVDNSLLTNDNNLYNVLHHEIVHCIGLDHSDKKGIMNYSLIMDQDDKSDTSSVVADTFKTWLSQDDVDGINFLQKGVK